MWYAHGLQGSMRLVWAWSCGDDEGSFDIMKGRLEYSYIYAVMNCARHLWWDGTDDD